jgi:hypothetical protein
MTRNWALHVDDMKHRNNQSEWFFVAVPIRNKDRIKNFMSAVVGKPLNWKGFTALMFCSSYGCKRDSLSPASMPSFFCSECFTIVLQQQGYSHFITTEPCETRPIDLKEMALSIPNSRETKHHPSASFIV